jgi:Flp pilus assembly protein TadB
MTLLTKGGLVIMNMMNEEFRFDEDSRKNKIGLSLQNRHLTKYFIALILVFTVPDLVGVNTWIYGFALISAIPVEVWVLTKEYLVSALLKLMFKFQYY